MFSHFFYSFLPPLSLLPSHDKVHVPTSSPFFFSSFLLSTPSPFMAPHICPGLLSTYLLFLSFLTLSCPLLYCPPPPSHLLSPSPPPPLLLPSPPPPLLPPLLLPSSSSPPQLYFHSMPELEKKDKIAKFGFKYLGIVELMKRSQREIKSQSPPPPVVKV